MATLRDIYRYLPSGATASREQLNVDNPYARANNSDMSDADWYAANMQDSSFEFTPQRDGGNGGFDPSAQWSVKPDSFLGRLQQSNPGAAAFSTGVRDGGEGGNGTGFSMDTSKLPTTRFGSVDRTAPVGEGQRLHNPSMVYDDPTYGKITPLMNFRSNGHMDIVIPMIMAAMTAGIGSLAGAGAGAAGAQSARLGIGAVQAARAVGSGGNPLSALGGLAGGALGINPQLMSALRMAMAFQQRSGNGRG